MTLTAFLMGVGMVGAAFISGIIARTFWTREMVKGAGLWLAAVLFMGAVASIASAFKPIIEPLWLQYALLLAVPFFLGYIGLLLLSRGEHRKRIGR